jgi:glycosyl transferase family 25
MQPAIFLINLDRARDRLTFIEQQTERLGFTFERVSAVDGRNVPGWLQLEFPDGTDLSCGQIGCYASHLAVANLIVSRELDHAIVLEDDAEIDESFLAVASAAIEALPPGWDYVHLSSRFKKSVIKVAPLGQHALVRYTENPINTAAYILSRRGARKWLAPMTRVRPIDVDARFADLKTFGVYPAIVQQSDRFRSQIGSQRPSSKRPRKWHPGLLSRLCVRRRQISELGLRQYVAGCSMNVINSIRKRIDGISRVSVIAS